MTFGDFLRHRALEAAITVGVAAVVVGAFYLRTWYRSRPGARSPAFCLLKVLRVGAPGDTYLWRLRVVQTPWFALWLHRIGREDRDRALHDHPRAFLAFVLLGGYVEQLPIALPGFEHVPSSMARYRIVRWFNFKRALDRHRIATLMRRPTWTLLLCGPTRGTWGFWTDRGYVPHDRYAELGNA